MTDEKPPVLAWGDAIQAWSDRWRKADPIDVDAAVAEGVSLCDAVIAWATPLLANAAVRPPSPDHLLLLRALLGSWGTGAWRLQKRLPPGRAASVIAAAVNRSWSSIHALGAAEAAIRAARPPEPRRDYLTQEEARDAIRLRRAMDG